MGMQPATGFLDQRVVRDFAFQECDALGKSHRIARKECGLHANPAQALDCSPVASHGGEEGAVRMMDEQREPAIVREHARHFSRGGEGVTIFVTELANRTVKLAFRKRQIFHRYVGKQAKPRAGRAGHPGNVDPGHLQLRCSCGERSPDRARSATKVQHAGEAREPRCKAHPVRVQRFGKIGTSREAARVSSLRGPEETPRFCGICCVWRVHSSLCAFRQACSSHLAPGHPRTVAKDLQTMDAAWRPSPA